MSQPFLVPCPFCRRALGPNPKLLYDHHVCSKCYYAFANRRQGAYLLDWIVWQAINFGVGYAVGAAILSTGHPITADSRRAIALLAWVIFPIFLMKDGFRGQSLGKLACGLQVININTRQPIGFIASLKRNLPLIIPLVPLIVAFQLARGKRWGDGWSHSLVIWKQFENSCVFGNQGFCEGCQYDLRGNVSGTCPECGIPVSSANRRHLQIAENVAEISSG